MKRLLIASIFLTRTLIADDHEEVFIGTGKTAEDAKLDAYRSIGAQGKPINSFVSSETRSTGTNSYITVFKIKTN